MRKRSTYLLEAPGEAERLISKVDRHAWVARYIRPLAADGPVLEVGAGPSHLLAAAVAGTGQIGVAVDISQPRLRAGPHPDRDQPTTPHDQIDLRPGRPYPVCGDAQHLPLRTGAFGLTYARFILEYLEDPMAAVREMTRVTRPGGHLLLQDLDGQLLQHYPVDIELQTALETFLSRIRGRLDPNIGRKLYSMARKAGLHDLTVRLEPYHLIAGAADPATLALWDAKLTHALPAAVDVLGSTLAHATKQRFLDYLADPATLTYSHLFTVTGRVDR